MVKNGLTVMSAALLANKDILELIVSSVEKVAWGLEEIATLLEEKEDDI